MKEIGKRGTLMINPRMKEKGKWREEKNWEESDMVVVARVG